MSKIPDPPKGLRIEDDSKTPEVVSTENFPKIGEMVTTTQALALCRDFGLEYLAERIECDPDEYKEWEFDGCSGIPDELMGLFTGCDWKDITFKCCLPHDLGYGYGELGNEGERKEVDTRFYEDLIKKAGMAKWRAAAFYAGVRAGGYEIFGQSFSWGFAHKK